MLLNLGGGAGRLVRRLALPGFLVAGVALSGGPGTGTPQELGVLEPGEPQERPIAAGEVQVWRATVAGAPLLVVGEQRGADLVVVDRPLGGGEAVMVDAPNHPGSDHLGSPPRPLH